MARPTNRKRHPLSEAVIELRTSLGDTQQQFAERLHTALSTVARYETSRPPAGGMLLRLAVIAEQRAIGRQADDAKVLIELATGFQRLYLEEVFGTIGVNHNLLRTFPDGETYVFAKFKSDATRKAIAQALAKAKQDEK
jgi:transcriptional regulator with XRE-family HTH domain